MAKISKQMARLGADLFGVVFAGGLINYGLNIWETGQISNKGIFFEAGALSKPLGFLMIGLGGLIFLELFKGIKSRVQLIMPLLMFSFLGPVILSFGVFIADSALRLNADPVSFARYVAAILLLGFGAYVTVIVIREFYRLWSE